ncbi:MAG TPA: hypothetical protein VFK07_03285, partial [Candidatus Paceibacterota bacterium]|nr:hypothetical protein [Candidatus Paceibacterota bacterium]
MRSLTITLLLLLALPVTVRAETRRFWVVNAITAAATAYDIETTLYALNKGSVESNPLIRPLLPSRPKVYLLEFGVDAVAAIWSHKKHIKQRFWPQIAITGAHGVIGTL